MKNKWRMPHPATMFLLLTMAVVFLSWICDIYGLKVTLPQTGEDIRVQSLLSPEGIRWWLRNAIKNFTGFAPLLKSAVCISMAFCVVISALVFVFARPLMAIFVDAGETEVILEGVRYLRIEGAFYCGIGCLFLLYGLYRALGRPGMSVVLTVVSLGTRVALAYLLSAIPAIGVIGIWWSVPIGWALADLTGLFYYKARKKELLA